MCDVTNLANWFYFGVLVVVQYVLLGVNASHCSMGEVVCPEGRGGGSFMRSKSVVECGRVRGGGRQMVSINKHAEPGRCMVVGCEGKALYRGRKAKNERGYCRAHMVWA